MKPFQIDRSNLQNKSFTVKRHLYPNFLKVWHYHTELELVLTIKSSGTRFIGDNIGQFSELDLVLIGKNVPHMWLNDKEYFEKDSKLVAEAIVIHFKEDFMGMEFLNLPEMTNIKKLLERSIYGIKFHGNLSNIMKKIRQIIELEGFVKTMVFIEILNDIAKLSNYKKLSSLGFITSFNKLGSKNLDKVHEFIMNNFKKNIPLEHVARIANMNPSAFSRFFKRVNRKTFTRYLNEVRIGYACKLLIEKKYNISEVCYESGFNNISNFNRQFKSILNYAPTEYIKQHSKVDIIK